MTGSADREPFPSKQRLYPVSRWVRAGLSAFSASAMAFAFHLLGLDGIPLFVWTRIA